MPGPFVALTAHATVWLAIATTFLALSTSLLAAFAAGAYIVARRELREQTATANRAYRHSRARITLEAMHTWRIEARAQWQELVTGLEVTNQAALVAKLEADPSGARKWVSPMLESLEHLAAGTHIRAYDVNVIWQISRSYIENVTECLEPYLAVAKHEQPSAYEHLTWLVAKLADMNPAPLPPPPEPPVVGELSE